MTLLPNYMSDYIVWATTIMHFHGQVHCWHFQDLVEFLAILFFQCFNRIRRKCYLFLALGQSGVEFVQMPRFCDVALGYGYHAHAMDDSQWHDLAHVSCLSRGNISVSQTKARHR